MAIYKPYPKYKNSNIPWLGEIPEHWMKTKPKFVGFLFGGLSGKSGSDFSKDFVKGYKAYIPFTNIANNRIISLKNLHYVKIGENEKQNKVQKGDLFFLMSSENFEDIGKTALLNDEVEDVYLNSFCKGFRITDNNFDSSFINYLFNADVNRKQLIIQARGFTRINLKIGKVNDLQLFTPTDIEEQTAIARFLDYKLAKINRFTQKKKQLIKLLNEQKAAIINQAVTKGLDPNVKMKDSGIEWLGEIPEHWETIKLSSVCGFVRGNSSFKKDELLDEGKYVALQYGKTYKVDEVDEKYQFYVNDEFYKDSQIVKYGDVIIISTSETVEDLGHSVFYNRLNIGLLGGEQILLRPKQDIVNGKYLYYSSKVFAKELRKYATGVKVYRFNIDDLKTIYISVPPFQEQVEIVNYIETESQRINTTITKIEKEIALVEEYKTALIAEAVTGKIDVRGYEVPEISEEETYEEIEDPDSYRDSMAAEDAAEYENESDL